MSEHNLEPLDDEFFDFMRQKVSTGVGISREITPELISSRIDVCTEELRGHTFGDIAEYALMKRAAASESSTPTAIADSVIAGNLLLLVYSELDVGEDGLRGYERQNMADQYMAALRAPIDPEILNSFFRKAHENGQGEETRAITS